MNDPVSIVLSVLIGIWATWMIVRFFAWTVVGVIEYFQDRKVNAPGKDTGEPYAGKTIGL